MTPATENIRLGVAALRAAEGHAADAVEYRNSSEASAWGFFAATTGCVMTPAGTAFAQWFTALGRSVFFGALSRVKGLSEPDARLLMLVLYRHLDRTAAGAKKAQRPIALLPAPTAQQSSAPTAPTVVSKPSAGELHEMLRAAIAYEHRAEESDLRSHEKKVAAGSAAMLAWQCLFPNAPKGHVIARGWRKYQPEWSAFLRKTNNKWLAFVERHAKSRAPVLLRLWRDTLGDELPPPPQSEIQKQLLAWSVVDRIRTSGDEIEIYVSPRTSLNGSDRGASQYAERKQNLIHTFAGLPASVLAAIPKAPKEAKKLAQPTAASMAVRLFQNGAKLLTRSEVALLKGIQTDGKRIGRSLRPRLK